MTNSPEFLAFRERYDRAVQAGLVAAAAVFDRDKVQVRVLGRFHCHPVFLSRLST